MTNQLPFRSETRATIWLPAPPSKWRTYPTRLARATMDNPIAAMIGTADQHFMCSTAGIELWRTTGGQHDRGKAEIKPGRVNSEALREELRHTGGTRQFPLENF